MSGPEPGSVWADDEDVAVVLGPSLETAMWTRVLILHSVYGARDLILNWRTAYLECEGRAKRIA